MPLDSWMPRWDARSTHEIEVAAEPDRVYQALLATDFGRNRLLRALMTLRAVPALALSPRAAWTSRRAMAAARAARPTRSLLSGAFAQLEAAPPTELVLGLTGRFWSPSGGLVPSDPATFREPVPHGLARATWSFHIAPISPGRCCLRTETRVLCADPATRRSFLLYWRVIRGGSGMIRWALLRQVKQAAERPLRYDGANLVSWNGHAVRGRARSRGRACRRKRNPAARRRLNWCRNCPSSRR